MSCCNLDKFSISPFINFFHPNLELSSKRLKLAFLFKTTSKFFLKIISNHFFTIQEVSMTIQDFIKYELIFMA
ncbi:hypothetical protein FJR77_04100 [Streptococcus shenyangsis]|uniref:Uncharacterized protein n=1 Tax=Streptococcus shenyangsis TaxID=2589786 RepID=A0ABY2YIC6_9STRE|nr:hypothetical protein FJR77_04100 [Streptococcus shenyangsis]TPE40782.1 hypothetical protein FJR73_03770 [Streptococcus sp. D2]